MKYEPPYNIEEVKSKYGEKTFNRLYNDPCHRWRMETGIELIHREPTVDEFVRICKNWTLMTKAMKMESDKKSIEIFGIDNMTNAKQLAKYYKIERG